MRVDLRLPAFSFTALCHVRAEALLPSGTPCELHYVGAPDGLDRDVRVYVVGGESASMGEEAGLVLGFLKPEAHRDRLKQGTHIELRRGPQLIAVGDVVVCGLRG